MKTAATRRNCFCGKFMTLVFEDGGRNWSRQEWACKCGRKDFVEDLPEEREPDPDLAWDMRHDR